jgi:ribonuclease HI
MERASMNDRWARMRFKKNKVWVAVEDDGRPEIVEGRARIRYRREEEREYRVNPENLSPLDAPESEPEKRPAPRKPAAAAPTVDDRTLVIYTDGASSGNPGPAGIGVVLQWGGREREISRYIGTATNNIAELEAIRTALAAVKNPRLPIVIYTDSRYAHGLLTQGWKARKNTALVEEIRRRLSTFPDVKIRKVRGHSGNRGNERADQLATEAIRSRAGSR